MIKQLYQTITGLASVILTVCGPSTAIAQPTDGGTLGQLASALIDTNPDPDALRELGRQIRLSLFREPKADDDPDDGFLVVDVEGSIPDAFWKNNEAPWTPEEQRRIEEALGVINQYWPSRDRGFFEVLKIERIRPIPEGLVIKTPVRRVLTCIHQPEDGAIYVSRLDMDLPLLVSNLVQCGLGATRNLEPRDEMQNSVVSIKHIDALTASYRRVTELNDAWSRDLRTDRSGCGATDTACSIRHQLLLAKLVQINLRNEQEEAALSAPAAVQLSSANEARKTYLREGGWAIHLQFSHSECRLASGIGEWDVDAFLIFCAYDRNLREKGRLPTPEPQEYLRDEWKNRWLCWRRLFEQYPSSFPSEDYPGWRRQSPNKIRDWARGMFSGRQIGQAHVLLQFSEAELTPP